MITDRDRPLRYLIVLLFIIYLIVVPVWVVFFKSDPHIFFRQYWLTKQFADTEMLYGFTDYVNTNPFSIVVGDMVLNVLAFVPFGVYLEMLYHDKVMLPKILIIALVSIVIEVLQFSLQFGSTDIVDLISNTLGGIIGILAMRLIYSKKSVKVILVLALIFTAATCISVGVHTVNEYYSIQDYYNSEQYEIYLETVQNMTSLNPD